METIWPVLWYMVLGASVVMYTILDGFDLGVGAVHLLARTDEERRIFLNAIGPVWDGNEVWLVVIIGGLFAGFPLAYASLFSGFYTLFMIFIAAIIFRAVAIEFRSKKESRFWRATWDTVFSFASIVFAFTIGLTFGLLIEGVPLDSSFVFMGDFKTLLRPYPILVAVTGVAVLSMHGTIYLFMKTEGELHMRLKKWITPSIILFIVLYIISTIVTVLNFPYMTKLMRSYPYLFVVPFFALLAIIHIPFLVKKDKDGWAFIASSLSIALLIITSFLGQYPNLIRSSISPETNSVTIFNAASSDLTLKILLSIAAIGIPFVFAYGIWVYRIFRGKVVLDQTSY